MRSSQPLYGFAFKQFGKANAQAKELSEGARRANMSTKDYAALNYVSKETGVSMENLTGVLQKLNDAIDKTAHGNEAYLSFWMQLGLSFTKLEKLAPVDKLAALQSAIKSYGKSLEEIPHAEEIFGKGGLMDLSKLGTADVGLIVEVGKSLGYIFTEDQITTMNNFAQRLGKVSDQTMMATLNTLHYIEALEKLDKIIKKDDQETTPPEGMTSYAKELEKEYTRLYGKPKMSYEEYVDFAKKRHTVPSNSREYFANLLKHQKNGVSIEELEKKALELNPDWKEHQNRWIADHETARQRQVETGFDVKDVFVSMMKNMPTREKTDVYATDADMNMRANYLIRDAQAQMTMDFMKMMSRFTESDLANMHPDASAIFKSFKTNPDRFLNDKRLLNNFSIFLSNEANNNKLSEDSRRKLTSLSRSMPNIFLDDAKIEELKKLFVKEMKEVNDTFVKAAKDRLVKTREALEQVKVETGTYGDITSIVRDMAEAKGMSMEQYLEEQKSHIKDKHPELTPADIEERFFDLLSDSISEDAMTYAEKLDKEGQVPSTNDALYNAGKIFSSLRKKQHDTMKKSLKELFNDVQGQFDEWTLGEKEAEKKRTVEAYKKQYGKSWTLDAEDATNRLIDLKYAMRDAESNLSTFAKNDIIYTNELARKRRLAGRRGRVEE